jgi:AcrR family transcriptional regulator
VTRGAVPASYDPRSRRAPRRARARARRPEGEAKRARIVQAALRQFARRGYQEARVEDVALALGIAKGSVFQHFKSKEGLFLAVYEKAVGSMAAYLDAPPEIVRGGFFRTLRYWLERTERLVHEQWESYRVLLLGNYGTDLRLRRAINHFHATRDPYGTAAFVRRGIERGEIRTDVPSEMIVSMVEWMVERFQDALLTEELDPGLFRRHGASPERTQQRIDQFLRLLRDAIGRR